MDPSTFPAYYQALPAMPPAMRQFPYPTSTASGASNRGMIFYPQPVSVGDARERSTPPSASGGEGQSSPVSHHQKRPVDKKMRRQIANSNERRRMQSINAGFHTLRMLMPHLQGEKLSKASVLQHAAEHIYRLNQEREQLVQQNTSLRMMLQKYWPGSDLSRGEVLTENKVNKATSPVCVDEEKAAAKEMEQIFAAHKEVDRIKEELERERSLRLSLQAKYIKDQTPSEDEDESDNSELSDEEEYRNKRPRMTVPIPIPIPMSVRDTSSPMPKNNLDIIVRAIRQIEGDAFSRSTTPTCGLQERERSSSNGGTFRPISSGNVDSSRVSPVTPVCAS